MSAAKSGSVNRSPAYRGENDFYATPAGATRALLALSVLPKEVWEPACGDGAMAEVLRANGHAVVASDLVDRGYGSVVDFLRTSRLEASAIVTNPPFGIADEFIAHALRLGPDVACFLLRLKWLEGRRRYERIFSEWPLAEVHVFIERVKFFSGDVDRASQPGWNTEAFAWFIWRRGHVGAPTLGWVSRDTLPSSAEMLS